MDYLNEFRKPVEQLQHRMQKTHQNLNQIKSIMTSWIKIPLFERKDSRKDSVLCMDERNERISKRYAEMTTASATIHRFIRFKHCTANCLNFFPYSRLLEENQELFGTEDSASSEMWLNYVAFVDGIVFDNLMLTVGMSLGYITEQMDASGHHTPLFESRFELLDPDLIFVPSLDANDPKGFNQMLIVLIDDIIEMASLIECLRTDAKASYMEMIAESSDIKEMKTEILDGVMAVMDEAADFCRDFERYSYLWLEDREQCMGMFLEYGRFLDSEELDLIAMLDPAAPDKSTPTIEAFREQIDHYESLYVEIERIEAFHVFNGWFQVDVRPFRQSLLNIVRKWGNMFKNHLVDRVTSSLTDLGEFIRKADEGLLQPVVEGDYVGLVNTMAYLMNVKERVSTTDEMFEPMQETIDLLKYYDMDIPEQVNVLLQELPMQWANTKKIAATVKQQVAPLQAIEVVAIRNKIANFDAHINFFRDVFKNYDFFRYSCDESYVLIDRINGDIGRLEGVMKGIQSSGSLFEVNVPEFKILKQCRKELKLLKVNWEIVVRLRKRSNGCFPATLGLHFPREDEHRGLEEDAMAQDRRGEYGH